MTFREVSVVIGIVAMTISWIGLVVMIIDTHEMVKRIDKYLEDKGLYDDQQP